MFPKYELSVSFKGSYMFTGAFVSLNKAIKVACCFDDECKMRLYSVLYDKVYDDCDVKNFVKEFRNGEILI